MKPIPKHFSIYLDLLRFGAAYFVLLFHIRNHGLGPADIIKFIPARGHDFVILFFVLSGYVITATVDRKKSSFRDYALDRVARVYSVIIPTLMLCFVLALFYGDLLIELPKLLVSFFSLGQSWFFKVYPFWNQPYWSLSYEVMYYIGFGFFIFFKGWKRWALLLLFVLLAGPKILLLMPCWLLGSLIYYYRDRFPLKLWQSLLLAFILPVAITLLFNQINFGEHARHLTDVILGSKKADYEFSGMFLVDYVTAIIVAINIYAMRFVMMKWPHQLESFIKKGADMSFTLYLMHIPFLFLLPKILNIKIDSFLMLSIAMIVVPIICYCIAAVTESRRGELRIWLDKVL